MIDFTNAVQKNKTYAGANGSKILVSYMIAETAFTRRRMRT